MSSFEKENIFETKKQELERGKNVKVITSFYRHGARTEEGTLSELGLETAEDLGKTKEVPAHGIKFRTSPFERAQKTTEGVLSGIEEIDSKKRVFKTEVRLELAPPKWKHLDEIALKVKKIRSEKGDVGVFEYTLQEPLMQEDLDSWTSGLAYFIKRYSILTERARSNFEIELDHITHDSVIGNFLRKMIVAEDGEGKRIDFSDFNKFKEFMGGGVEYLEGFEFMMSSDEAGTQQSKILFRGQEYEVDMNKLNKLAEKFEKEPYLGRIDKQNI
ncbi:MAG: histidine phosphatase family protein [Patescibacteria group bacterium]